jgi:hypothetical protein
MKSAKFTTALLNNLFLNQPLELGEYFYLSLHTKNPVGGDQKTHEVSYPGYKRVAVKRDTSGWEVNENCVSLLGVASFPQCTDKIDIEAPFIAFGTHETGEGMILYVGECAKDEPFYIFKGVTPQLTPATTLIEG